MKTGMMFVVIAVAAMIPKYVWAQDYSGQWLGKVTESQNSCEDLGKADPGDYKLTIVHTDNEILIMENVVQHPYKGVVNPKQPRNVHVQGSYSVDGGYVTEVVEIIFENKKQGTGQSVWTWSDGYYQCGGRFKFKLTFIRE